MENFSKHQLPLHEVTRLYGEDGLEERFCHEVDSLNIPSEDQRRIQEALALALSAHLPQTRGEHPYSTHILRVSARIIHHFKVIDPDIIIAALLHDIVEDQAKRMIDEEIDLADDIEYKSAALSLIDEQFGSEVATLVAKVTNHNFNESPKKSKKLAEKYLPLIPVMKEFAIMASTPLESEARDYIIERLSRAEDRCHKLLET